MNTEKTIPAIITKISDKVMVSGHLLPEPPSKEAFLKDSVDISFDFKAYYLAVHNYEASAFTAEVENACKYDEPKFAVINPGINNYEIVPLGQSCRITKPVNGKCEIVELNN